MHAPTQRADLPDIQSAMTSDKPCVVHSPDTSMYWPTCLVSQFWFLHFQTLTLSKTCLQLLFDSTAVCAGEQIGLHPNLDSAQELPSIAF